MHHAAGRECFVYSRTDFYAREWDWREKMKKAVFFDIDGTLWNEHMQVPESTTKAIRELRNAGNYAFLCSGRSRSNIRSEKILGIGFDGIVAACGTHIEYEGKKVSKASILALAKLAGLKLAE